MNIDRLLAKSGKTNPGSSLQGHTLQVMESTQLLLDHRLESAEQTMGRKLPRLPRIVLLSAFLHDLGKGNDVFQFMVRGRNVRQPIRHEALSLLLAKRVLRDWLLESYTNEEIDLAAVAAAGHHRKFTERAVAPADAGAPVCNVLLDHPDFEKTLRLGVKRLGLPSVPPQALQRLQLTSFEAQDLLDQIHDDLDIEPDDIELATAKAFLLAADVLGSAEPRSGVRKEFVENAFAQRSTSDSLGQIAKARLGEHLPRRFQRDLAESTAPVTLATAGCGTGKTIGAYLWAQQHAGRQLWFCYPTTGTATEGFRDYLVNVGLETRLEHSRREIDIDLLSLVDGNQEDAVLRDLARLEALRIWGSEVISCTVDTVLGLLQCQRRGMYAWPGLADATIVFDEVHAYDDRMFGGLLRLLQAMPGTPVLLMTATLPDARLEQLRTAVTSIHGSSLAEVHGPAELEALERYVRSNLDPDVAVEQCLSNGGKVLWVCNTVGRCQEIADHPWSVRPMRYHSRYRYRDRVARHRDVIDAFGQPGPCLAVTTQVCEMSLDLSADLLITELAPVSSLVQRLGRLNRNAATGDSPKPFVVIEPAFSLPYAAEALEHARQWLAQPELVGPASQQGLAEAWRRLSAESSGDPITTSSWLDGGFLTEPREVREASPSLTILLPQDAASVEQGSVRAIEVAVPMNPPPGRGWLSWRRVRHIPVPPEDAVSYDPERGAAWLR